MCNASRKLEMAMTSEFQAFMEEHFSLDNYAGAADLDLNGWYYQLRIRDTYLQAVNESDRQLPLRDHLLHPLKYHGDFPMHKRHKAVRIWDKLDYYMTKKCVDLCLSEYKAVDARLMEFDSKVPSLDVLTKGLMKDEPEEFKFLGLCVGLRTEELNFSLDDLADTPPLHNAIDIGCSDLKVDMYYSDKQLISAFKAWLPIERARRTEEFNEVYTKRNYGDLDMENWTRFRVLEYIDLKIAADHLNEPLNDNEIAWFLLKDLAPGTNPLDRLRTIKKHAEKMIQWESIQALEIQSRISI
jgi:hypothetical protein